MKFIGVFDETISMVIQDLKWAQHKAALLMIAALRATQRLSTRCCLKTVTFWKEKWWRKRGTVFVKWLKLKSKNHQKFEGSFTRKAVENYYYKYFSFFFQFLLRVLELIQISEYYGWLYDRYWLYLWALTSHHHISWFFTRRKLFLGIFDLWSFSNNPYRQQSWKTILWRQSSQTLILWSKCSNAPNLLHKM